MSPLIRILISALSLTVLPVFNEAYGATFPNYTDAFCRRVTSKMLDPDEKRIETNSCLQDEAKARKRLEDHWSLTTNTALKSCQTTSNNSYGVLEGCLSWAAGWKCFRDELDCQWN